MPFYCFAAPKAFSTWFVFILYGFTTLDPCVSVFIGLMSYVSMELCFNMGMYIYIYIYMIIIPCIGHETISHCS